MRCARSGNTCLRDVICPFQVITPNLDRKQEKSSHRKIRQRARIRYCSTVRWAVIIALTLAFSCREHGAAEGFISSACPVARRINSGSAMITWRHRCKVIQKNHHVQPCFMSSSAGKPAVSEPSAWSGDASPRFEAVPLPELNHDEVRRYSRHLILSDVGVNGQQRLKASSVLAVGTGGLGSPSLLYLAAAGIGRLGIVDDDIVDESNLQRQVRIFLHVFLA